MDDDHQQGVRNRRGSVQDQLAGLGQLRHAEPQCRRHVDHDSPAEQWRRLQQRQGHPLQLQLPEGRLRQARSAASSRRAAGTESGSHLRQRGFHPLSGGARHPDRQPGRFILLYPATGRLGGQHDREHVRRGQLLQPDPSTSQSPTRTAAFSTVHSASPSRAPTIGPNWNCSAAMITASLFPRVRRPTETRRPTPQSP